MKMLLFCLYMAERRVCCQPMRAPPADKFRVSQVSLQTSCWKVDIPCCGDPCPLFAAGSMRGEPVGFHGGNNANEEDCFCDVIAQFLGVSICIEICWCDSV